MADTAQFVVKLVDRVSSNAKKSAHAIRGLDLSVNELQRRFKITRYEALKMWEANKQAERAANRAAGATRGQSGATRGLTGMIKGAAAAWVVYKTAALAASGAMAVVDRSIKTDRIVATLDQLTHHRGVDTFREMRDLSVQFGLDIDETSKSYANFLKLQFSPAQAKQMLKLGADMQALGNTSDDVQGIFRAMGQIKSKDKLQAEEILQLAERGVSGKLIRENVAKLMGVAVDEVESLQRRGMVKGDIGLKAIEMALNEKLGQKRAGESGEKFVKATMAGALASMKQRGKDLWIEMTDQVKPGLSAGITKAQEVLNNFLASSKGQRVLEFLGEAMRSFGKALEVALPLITEVGGALLSGFVRGFEDADDSMSQIFGPNGLASAEEWAAFIRETVIPQAEALGRTLGEMASNIAAITKALGLVSAGVSVAMDPLTPKMHESGSMAMRGFLAGLQSVPVLGTMVNLARQIHGAFSGPDGIDEGSPSKLFEHSGDMSGQGYMRGLEKSMPDGAAFAPTLNNAAIAAGASRLASSGASGGGQISIGDVTVVVDAAGSDPAAVGAATVAAFEANLSSILSKYQTEVAA